MEPKPGLVASLFDFSFNEFITTRIIKFIYALGIVVAAIGAIGFIISGFANSAGVGVLFLLLSPLAFLLYVVMIRVWLEVLIVIFRIAEHASAIEDHCRKAPAAASTEGQV
jgi:uncharacterized membrane protein